MIEGERTTAEDGQPGEPDGEKSSHIAGFAGMPSPDAQVPPEHEAVEGRGFAIDALGRDETDDRDAHGERATPVDG